MSIQLPNNDNFIIIDGLHIRESDEHFIKLGKDLRNYQSKIRISAYKYVINWRVALDVGGHIGIFTTDFASRFEHVLSFEPMPFNRACLEKNAPPNVTIYPFALGDKCGYAEMRYNIKNSGGSEVVNPSEIASTTQELSTQEERIIVPVKPLDDFSVQHIDLIKIDVQGMEEHVLKGGKQTFLNSRPVVILEEKVVKSRPLDRTAIERAQAVILEFGYMLAEIVGNDAIYIPKERSVKNS